LFIVSFLLSVEKERVFLTLPHLYLELTSLITKMHETIVPLIACVLWYWSQNQIQQKYVAFVKVVPTILSILGGIKIIFIHVVTTLCRYIKIKCFLLFVRVGRCILNLIKHSYHIRLQCRPSNLMIVSNARFSSKLCSLMAHIKVFLILLSPQKNESKRKFVYN
jgi:hypothetical protein